MRSTPATTWTFKPSPKHADRRLTWFQSWIVTRAKRWIVAVAARRSGKTVGVRGRLLTRALSEPNSMFGYCAPTLKQAKRLIWLPLMRDFREPEARAFVRHINKSELRIEFKNGSMLFIFGAEAPEGIRGGDPGWTEFWCDEADDPNFDTTFFDEIVGPALSDQEGTLGQIGSPKGRGRLYHEFRKGSDEAPTELRDPDYDSIQVTAAEAGIISREELARAKRQRPPRAYRQEYEASFEAPVGVIYDEWSEPVHVFGGDAPSAESFERVIACVDWGTANRGTMLILGIDSIILPASDEYDADRLARVTVLAEESHTGVGYDDDGWWSIARSLQDRWEPSTWYCDPAGGLEGYIRQLRNALAGTRASVVPADNQVRPGIAAVQQMMHHAPELGEPPRLRVHESCRWLRDEVASYRWKSHPSIEDEFTDEPMKIRDHSLDALRYGIFSDLYKPAGRKRRGSLEDRGR